MSSGSWVLPDELKQLAECGDESLVKEVIGVFRTDTADRLGKLRAAVAQNDRREVRAQSHAMKGSAGQVGARALAALCLEIEQQHETADASALASLVERVEAAFREVSRLMPA